MEDGERGNTLVSRRRKELGEIGVETEDLEVWIIEAIR